MTAHEAADGVGAEELAVARAQRDPRDFGALYERNFDLVYAFVSRRVRDRNEAEDVTATVFQKALAALPKFEWRGAPFAAWLVGIARNELIDRMRRRRPTAVLDDEEPADDHDLDEVEQRATIFGLVRGLPEMQRRVVVMRFAEDKGIREIADTLGRTEGAVKQLQLRALQTLRARLGDADA